MRLVVAAIGRLKDGPERELAERYRKRAEQTGRRIGFRDTEVVEIRESRAQEVGKRMIEESIALTSLIPDKAVTIDLTGKTAFTDAMVVTSGRSNRHVGAVADRVLEGLKKAGIKNAHVEGMPHCDWVLIDAGDVVVHLFRPEVRSFYNLERMWGFGDEPAAAGGRA